MHMLQAPRCPSRGVLGIWFTYTILTNHVSLRVIVLNLFDALHYIISSDNGCTRLSYTCLDGYKKYRVTQVAGNAFMPHA